MFKKILEYYFYFFMYSCFGWIYEVFLEVVVYGWGFSNRGVLFGPYCPLYGFGSLIFLAAERFVKNNKKSKKLKALPFVFSFCALAATGIELIATYILEGLTGGWPWQTYKNYKINFQGRIALSTSLRFGLGGVLIVYAFQPALRRLWKKFNRLKAVSAVMALVMAADLIYTLLKQ